MVCVLPRGHRLTRRTTVRPSDLRGEPLVWWPEEHGPGAWREVRREVCGDPPWPSLARAEPEEERIVSAVAEGAGISFIMLERSRSLRIPGRSIAGSLYPSRRWGSRSRGARGTRSRPCVACSSSRSASPATARAVNPRRPCARRGRLAARRRGRRDCRRPVVQSAEPSLIVHRITGARPPQMWNSARRAERPRSAASCSRVRVLACRASDRCPDGRGKRGGGARLHGSRQCEAGVRDRASAR